jgi:cytochrome c biogenesis protein CcmG/thiol:disulfide interchange protein DsbE
MNRLLFIAPLVIFGVFALATGWYMLEIQKDPQRAPNVLGAGDQDKPLPEFDLPPLIDGIPGFATGDFGGEVAVVNVFASWCIPCRAEHPLITRMAEEKIAPVYGLNYKDKKKDAIAWLDGLGNPYTRIGHDLSGRAGIEWGVTGVPETFIIDKKARIRYKYVGPIMAETLNEVIIPKIKELQAE